MKFSHFSPIRCLFNIVVNFLQFGYRIGDHNHYDDDGCSGDGVGRRNSGDDDW